jgi:hypothetical protein
LSLLTCGRLNDGTTPSFSSATMLATLEKLADASPS